MKLETFFEKFDQFADAPDAVAKMRELVLHLAFSGKLLPTAESWPVTPLKSLATKIGSGATPAGGRESYFTEGIPLIRSMNVHFAGFEPKGLVFLSDEQAKQLANVTVQPCDVLLNITGASIGRVTTTPMEMAGAKGQPARRHNPTDQRTRCAVLGEVLSQSRDSKNDRRRPSRRDTRSVDQGNDRAIRHPPPAPRRAEADRGEGG